jgi:predicted nuclease with TOPRIM domain
VTAPVRAATFASPFAMRVVGAATTECPRGDWNTSSNMMSSGNGRINRLVQKSFGDLRLCVAGEDVDGPDARLPSDWNARRLVLMSEERGGDVRRLEVVSGPVAHLATYSVNGRSVPPSDEVREWRRAVLEVLDAAAEVSELRGQVSSLQGEISSTQGERSSLQGEISSLRGEVSSMQGEISSIRGEESSMRGEISSIRGNYSSLQGQISSEQGAISSLQGSRNDRFADQYAMVRAIRRLQDEIVRLRGEIARYDVEGRVREVERRIRDYDADARVREMERRIRDFDVERKVADVQRRIAALDVEGQVASINREIAGLDADNRVAAIEARQAEALRVLRSRLRR